MGKKSPPPKAPDLTPITNAQLQIARDSNELAREFLGISREQFAWMQENAKEELALARQQADRLFDLQNRAFESGEQARKVAEEVSRKQMEAMDLQMEYARRDRERYESVFLPMQDQYITEAQEYDTPERRAAEAARASVDIQRQADAARQNADARLRSMGIDPSQMRSATLLDTQGVALAAQQAGAANSARQAVEDRGRAMRADALNVGAGLPAQALAGYNSAAAAGSAAVGSGQAGQGATISGLQAGAGLMTTGMGMRSSALNNLAQLTGSPTQWAGMGSNQLGQASSMYSNAANTMSQGFQNQMSSWKAGQEQSQQMFNNVMSVGSMAAGFMMAEGGSPAAIMRERLKGPGVREAIGTGGFESKVTQPGIPDRVNGGPSLRERIAGALSRAPTAPGAAAPPKSDPYIRAGSGSGEGGALTVKDRLSNASAAGQRFNAGNVWEGSTDYQPAGTLPVQPLYGDAMQWAAEGGRSGALPVRQQRDKIPAMVGEGEFIVPEDVVRAKGIEFFDKLVKKYHRSNA